MTVAAAVTASMLMLTVAAEPVRPEVFVKKDLGRVALEVPRRWKYSWQEGTDKWVAPSKEPAGLLLDVFANSEPRTSETCRDNLASALSAGKPWEKLEIGGAPAAHYVESAPQADGKDVAVHTWIGCNEKTHWVLRLAFRVEMKDRFLPVGERVVRSLTYK